MFVVMTVGCSPNSPPTGATSANDIPPEVTTEFESLASDSNLGATATPSDVKTKPSDSANVENDSEDSNDDEVNKFIGQDGRERVVPTGPPPTDSEGRLELTFDDLSFEMEKGGKFDRSMLTDRIKKFHEANVRLRGFIRPSFRQSDIEKFVFVRDDKECCFGPGAAIYDNALVSLKKGTQTDYTVRPVVVTGKLYLKEYATPDGMILSIYRIKNGKIE